MVGDVARELFVVMLGREDVFAGVSERELELLAGGLTAGSGGGTGGSSSSSSSCGDCYFYILFLNKMAYRADVWILIIVTVIYRVLLQAS